MNRIAVLYALASALLFGLSTPAAKVLVGSIHPVVLAGLLYCGAGFGILLLRRIVPVLAISRAREVPLGRADIPWLVGAIVAGGIVGPALLMVGLTATDAASASLLLTFEGAATAVMAWFIFHENFDRRIAFGMACLGAGAIVLAWEGAPELKGALGILAIIGACVAWGLDNNLTRRVSLADPLQIVALKGLIAGPVNVVLGLWAGGVLPSVSLMTVALLIGFAGYGVSLALFIIALRHLGTARTSAYFSVAPFFGAAGAVAALDQSVTLQLLAGGGLMAIGVWLHLTETHEHVHTHEPISHSHPHVHDEHHRHQHGPGELSAEPHTHVHRHVGLTHSHAHVPDMHHTHRH